MTPTKYRYLLFGESICLKLTYCIKELWKNKLSLLKTINNFPTTTTTKTCVWGNSKKLMVWEGGGLLLIVFVVYYRCRIVKSREARVRVSVVMYTRGKYVKLRES